MVDAIWEVSFILQTKTISIPKNHKCLLFLRIIFFLEHTVAVRILCSYIFGASVLTWGLFFTKSCETLLSSAQIKSNHQLSHACCYCTINAQTVFTKPLEPLNNTIVTLSLWRNISEMPQLYSTLILFLSVLPWVNCAQHWGGSQMCPQYSGYWAAGAKVLKIPF